MKVFGFVGVGNMGGALARAACKSAGAENVLVTDLLPEKAAELAAETGCRAVSTEELVATADYLFLGAKPQGAAGLLAGLRDKVAAREGSLTLVSMMAGVTIARIRALLGLDAPIIRIMPNTPAAVGEGMILYTAEQVCDEAVQAFLTGMSAAGRFDLVPEPLFDAATAISGCGPAFLYMVLSSMADAGVVSGLGYQKALTYAAQTMIGAAEMVLQSGQHPEALKNAVCSPAGSTIAGVHALETAGFRGILMDGVLAAYRKTQELGK